MKRLMLPIWVLISVFLFSNLVIAQDEKGFAWRVTCQFVDAGQQTHYWVGYTSSTDLPDSYLAYIGNGPGIEMDHPKTGGEDYAVDVLLPDDDSTVTLFLYRDDVSITIDHDIEAPGCDKSVPGGGEQPVTLDDEGNVNNPLVNERANTCYDPGQVCITVEEWERGWYLIREQYGLP